MNRFFNYKRIISLLIIIFLFMVDKVDANTLILPDDLTRIEEEAFLYDDSIDTVILPDGIQFIGERAFANSSILEITLPDSLNSIADNAFDNHVPNLIIKCKSGSEAESYAINHDIQYVLLDGPSIVITDTWEEFATASYEMIQDYSTAVSVNDESSEYVSGRLIVKTNGDLPDISGYNVKSIVRDPENHYILQFLSDSEAEICAEYLANCSGVIYVEAVVSTNSFSDNSTYGDEAQFYSWGVSAINADAYALDLKQRGVNNKTIVAVVDTGVDVSHQMLNGRVIAGYDFVQNDTTPQDGHGHGTHVSGTIVDCTPDLDVKIMPVRVLDDDGRGWSDVVGQGIRYAARSGAKVINLSLGGNHSRYKDEAIEYALEQGCTVVVAAGNDNNNTVEFCPAHILECITVSAVNSSKQKATFSNYGNAVDIAAPGVNIKSSIPGGGYASWNGTSMAAPHVSAAAAMLLCDYPGLSPSDVETMLRDAATDLGSTGWDPYYGAGFLNLEPFIKNGPEEYIISYDANGGTGAPTAQTKVQDVDLTLTSIKPSRSHTITFINGTGETSTKDISATFNNWNTEANGTGAAYGSGAKYTANEVATLYAQWTLGTIGTLPEINRDGYRLDGWFTANSGGTQVTESTVVSANMNIYAHWTKLKTYTVSYYANGGAGAPANQTKTEGIDLLLASKTPSKTNTVTFNFGEDTETKSVSATFKNWNTSQDGSGDTYQPEGTYSEDDSLTLYAQWNYGTLGDLPALEKDGYKLLGWYTEETDGTKVTSSTKVTKNVTYYAHWAETYTVTYDANGGTGAPEQQTKIQDEGLTLSFDAPTRSYSAEMQWIMPGQGSAGFNKKVDTTFIEWNTKADGSGTSYSLGDTYTENLDVVLYAQWDKATIGALLVPEDEGKIYTFGGWYTEEEGGDLVDNTYELTNDINLYGHWDLTASLTLQTSELSLDIDDECGLIPWITPNDAVCNPLSWVSSDSSIASVDSQGNVTAHSVGETVITVSNEDGLSATCNVTVTNVEGEAEEVRTSWAESYVNALTSKGNTVKFAMADFNGNDTPDMICIYDDGYWTDYTYYVDGIKRGDLTAQGFAMSYYPGTECIKRTRHVEIDRIVYTYEMIMRLVSEERELEITRFSQWARSRAGLVTTTVKISNNDNKISIDEFFAKLDNILNDVPETSLIFHANTTENWEKYILSLQPVTIKLSTSSLAMDVGDKCGITAWILPEHADWQSISWSSSNANVASVDNGVVTGNSAGTAIITAFIENGLSSTCNVTISNRNKHSERYAVSPISQKYSEFLDGFSGMFSVLDLTNDDVPDLAYIILDEDQLIFRVYINGERVESPGNVYFTLYYPKTGIVKGQYNDTSMRGKYYNYYNETGLIDCIYQVRTSYGTSDYYKSPSNWDSHMTLDKDGFETYLNSWVGDAQETVIVFHPDTEDNRNYYLHGYLENH